MLLLFSCFYLLSYSFHDSYVSALTDSPTSRPSYGFEIPSLIDTKPIAFVPYYCHSLSSKTKSIYKRIFYGLITNLTQTVPLQEAKIWVAPYDSAVDELSLFTNDYENQLFGNFNTTTGFLTIVWSGTVIPSNQAWSSVINTPMYKLIADNGSPKSCDVYIDNNVVNKTISIQLTNADNQVSNIVTRNIRFTSAYSFIDDKHKRIIRDRDTGLSTTTVQIN